jgi:hypothetical protein
MQNSVCAAERSKRLYRTPNVVIGDGIGAIHSSSSNTLSQLSQADETAILSTRSTAYLDDTHRELKVEVVDRLSQQLRPYRAPVCAAVAVAAGEGINADGSAHASELGAESWVGANIAGVCVCELL